jgi:branched-chain amino acid transport system ATP-binding protein
MTTLGQPSLEPLLAIRGLGVAYGRKAVALSDIDLVVPAGGIVALLGVNGAGKSTLIRAITGLIGLHGGGITQGTIHLAGQQIAGARADKIVRMGMGQVPEGRLVFKNLTVEENLNVGAAVSPRHLVKDRLDAVYALFPKLLERRNQAAGLMSGGEQQMLALGRALASSPRILLIDELSLGLAPLIVKSIYEQLVKIRDTFGTAILIVEQNARLALNIADTAYVLERGEIVLSGTASDVAASDQVREAYLGTRAETSLPKSA